MNANEIDVHYCFENGWNGIGLRLSTDIEKQTQKRRVLKDKYLDGNPINIVFKITWNKDTQHQRQSDTPKEINDSFKLIFFSDLESIQENYSVVISTPFIFGELNLF